MDQATEGCDALIRDTLQRLRPIEIGYKDYGYIDDQGVHLR